VVESAALNGRDADYSTEPDAGGWMSVPIATAVSIALVLAAAIAALVLDAPVTMAWIGAVLAVVEVAVARCVDQVVPIVLNEIDLAIAGVVVTAIATPVLALTGRHP
jgi:hypothetical protein